MFPPFRTSFIGWLLQCSATPFSPDDAEYEFPRGGEGFKDVASGGGVGETDGNVTVEPREFEVTVRYVRREIRDLTDRDREIFFNAISVLQRVPSAVGREIYGDNYYSRDYFNRLHFYGGEKKDQRRESFLSVPYGSSL